MRPKSKALLYCADELRLSVTALVLGSHQRYAVTQCFRREDVAAMVLATRFDAAVVMESACDGDHGESAVRLIKQARGSDLPVILDLSAPTVMATLADRVLVHDMRELLEVLRVVCARKRGPKKVVCAVQPATVAMEVCA